MGGMQVFSGRSNTADPQTPCCDLRSACLQTCGALKSFCDEDFLKCTKSVCADMDDDEDILIDDEELEDDDDDEKDDEDNAEDEEKETEEEEEEEDVEDVEDLSDDDEIISDSDDEE